MPKVFAATRFVLAAMAVLTTTVPALAEDGDEGTALVEANVALARWGAEAKGEGQPFNPGYPVEGVIDGAVYPALFGSKPRGIVGGSVTIDLALDTDVVAVVLTQASSGNRFDRAQQVRIDADDKKIMTITLANNPDVRQWFPLQVSGRQFRFTVLSQYDDPGTDFGGWNEIEILTEQPLDAKFALPESFRPTGPALLQPLRQETAVGATPEPTAGHPRTLWTSEELGRLKHRAAVDGPAKLLVERLVARADSLVARPVTIPEPAEPLEAEDFARHTSAARAVVNLALAEALTGRPRYGDAAVEILSRYARTFENYPLTGVTYTGRARVFNRRADLAAWLIHLACGYDLLHGRMTAHQRRSIGDKLLGQATHIIAEPPPYWSDTRPEVATVTAAVLTVGYALDDRQLIDWGLQGRDGAGGAYRIIDNYLTADGKWLAGPPGPPDTVAEAVLQIAECCWRNGVDLYSRSGGRIKRLFDGPLELAYPSADLPALGRASGETLLGPRLPLYGGAFARYGDPRHLLLSENVSPQLGARDDLLLPSPWHEVTQPAGPAPGPSANLADEGLVVLRVGHDMATTQMLLVCGREANPDRLDVLGFDLFGLGRPLMPSPGGSYSDDRLYDGWFRTTVAHNTIVIDQRRQVPTRATLSVLGATADVALARAWTDRAYPGVGLDRTLVLTRDYALDLAAVFSRLQRTVDLVYHGLGELDTSVRTSRPWGGGPLSQRDGYNQMADLRRGQTGIMWKATWKTEGRPPMVVAVPAGPETTLYTATGWMGIREAPLVIQRREAAETAFAAVVNLNKDSEFVTGVRWLETDSPSARALKIETRRGADYLLVNYAPGMRRSGVMRTDARVVFVRTRRFDPAGRPAGGLESIYLAGGSVLELLGGRITSTRPSLLAAEHVENGHFLVRNLAGAETEVRISGLDLPQVWDSRGHEQSVLAVDSAGRLVPADNRFNRWPDTIAMKLPAGMGFEFGPSGNSIFQQRAARDAQRYQARLNRARSGRMDALDRARRNEEEAARNPVTPGTVVVVEAEDFQDQGGGEVEVTEKKVAIRGGKAFLKWDDEGHWLQWRFDVPESGYYHLMLKSCSRDRRVRRLLEIDGSTKALPVSQFYLPWTGGWSNDKDDWRLSTVTDFRVGRPALVYLTRGRHTLRLTNLNGSANLDYLVIASPDVPTERDEFE